jgi:hypothetical protein
LARKEDGIFFLANVTEAIWIESKSKCSWKLSPPKKDRLDQNISRRGTYKNEVGLVMNVGKIKRRRKLQREEYGIADMKSFSVFF